jgi:hypothetical protein
VIGRDLFVFSKDATFDKAGAPPVPKVCHNAMFFGLLGLASSEKQIPQITENTEKSK